MSGSQPAVGSKLSFALSNKAAHEVVEAAETAKPVIPPPIDTGLVFTSGTINFLLARDAKQPSRDSLHPTAKELYCAVAQSLEDEPFEFEGKIWAGATVEQFACQLGVSVKQIQRIASKSPFRTVVKQVGTRNRKFIRLGHPSDMTDEDFARIMASAWRKHTGRRPNAKEFGCLVGIAKHDPGFLSPDIFQTVLANWTFFMSFTQQEIEMGKEVGDYFDKNPENFVKRFFHYPTITVIRRFWPTAQEAYLTLLQEKLSNPQYPLEIPGRCPFDYVKYITKIINSINE